MQIQWEVLINHVFLSFCASETVMWGNTYTRRRRLRDVRRAAGRAQSLAKGAGAVSG